MQYKLSVNTESSSSLHSCRSVFTPCVTQFPLNHCRTLFLLQIGRSTESPIDFVVMDMVPGCHGKSDTLSSQSTISRFACRIVCQRAPPYTARIYAAGFDSSKSIFLGVGQTHSLSSLLSNSLSYSSIPHPSAPRCFHVFICPLSLILERLDMNKWVSEWTNSVDERMNRWTK